MARGRSLKSWLARKLDARYVKRSEYEKAVARLEKLAKDAQAEARNASRMAREGGTAIESLLAAEVEVRQEIDGITGVGS